jgi:hypothetical protein
VVNIANVAVMSHITRIPALENATAIWEYDPASPGNHVLGGSLDVIASIQTIAIKVSDFLNVSTYSSFFFIRYRPLVSESNISKKFKFNARSPSPSKFPSIATFDGGQLILCLIARMHYAR